MAQQIKTNTATLQTILDAVNALPEATAPKLQAKTATPATSAQTVKPDSGYDGLSQVTVNAVPTATQATPSISVDSAGKITASATQTAGYVAAGTKSATKQLTTQAAKTVTPSTSSQTAVASGVYTTGAVTVAAIPSSYVKPSATKAATTYTPTTSNQTIAAGTYCSGAQTIKGDANLVAGNIKSGVSIFGVAGTMTAGEDVTAETETYTDLLTDLEAAVDALPDAGSGGESSGYQVATGVFNVASQVSEANAIAATVTGIPFKPRILLIQKAGSVSITISSINKNKYYFCGYEQYDDDIYYQYVNYTGSSASRARANSTSTLYKIEVNEDGFILKRGTSSNTTYYYYIGSGVYTYVAIS